MLFVPSLLNAQTQEKISLLEALKNLEETFEVRFSYSVEDIEGVEVTYRNLETLESELESFESEVPFIFNRISERYVSVIKEGTGFLCARLVDADSGKVLENATVISLEESFATVTNKDGYFYVPVTVSTSGFEIRFLGFEPIRIRSEELNSECPTLLMQTSISELATVVIRNYLVKGISKSGDGSIDISTSRFGLLPGQVENDVLQIAQALPGIQSVDETISNINIRGGTNDENLILWEDIKLYQNGHFFGLISAFNPDITQQVSIYKNGAPARYGDGISGVIAMRSNDEVADNFAAGAGSNLINAHFFGMVPVAKNLSFQISGRRSINSLWESPVYSSFSERIFQDTEITNEDVGNTGLTIQTEEDFDFYDLSLKILWDLGEKDRIRLNFLGINNTLTFSETIPETEFSEDNELEQQSLLGGISWSRQWSDALSTTAMGYATTYDLQALNRDILTTQEVFQENEVLETGVKLDAVYKLNSRWHIEGGYQFSETGIANTQDVNLPRFRDFDKDVLRTHAFHAGIKLASLNETTLLRVGARGNYYEKFQEYFIEPRLSLYQVIGSGFAVEVQGEFKSQTTTQRIDFNSDFLGVEKRRWVLATQDGIPVIESKQASVGIVYDKQGWFVNVEGFYKTVDGITSSNQGFQNQFQFERSTGSYIASGAELVLNKKTENYSVWASYAYLDNTYTFDDFTPSEFRHNLDITHSLNIAGSYSWGNLKLSTGLNWRTGKPYTLPLAGEEIVGPLFSEEIQYDLPNEEQLPDYMRVDFSAEYLWEISRSINAKLNFALLNLLDKQNTLNIRYALVSDSPGINRLNQIEQFSLGLTPNFSFQLLF